MNINQFAPRELCERLQKMGCVSESGFTWESVYKDVELARAIFEGRTEGKPEIISTIFFKGGYAPGDKMVFFQNDFTGATDQASENRRIVWESHFIPPYEECPMCEAEEPDRCAIPIYIARCHGMIEAYESEKEIWHRYLERTMKK